MMIVAKRNMKAVSERLSCQRSYSLFFGKKYWGLFGQLHVWSNELVTNSQEQPLFWGLLHLMAKGS